MRNQNFTMVGQMDRFKNEINLLQEQNSVLFGSFHSLSNLIISLRNNKDVTVDGLDSLKMSQIKRLKQMNKLSNNLYMLEIAFVTNSVTEVENKIKLLREQNMLLFESFYVLSNLISSLKDKEDIIDGLDSLKMDQTQRLKKINENIVQFRKKVEIGEK